MGGTFDKLVGKVLPGTYMNFESTRNDIVNNNTRGVVIIPLIGHTYGPTKEFFSIYSSAPDAEFNKLGISVYDDNNEQMIYIREALKKANEAIIYILGPDKKAAATVEPLTATAKYGGTLGNNFKLVLTANAVKGLDVSVYLNDTQVFLQESVEKAEDLEQNDYVVFSGTGELNSNAGTNFTGGTDSDSSATNKDITDFLDGIEKCTFNTLCFPVTDGALHTALKTKIKYLREEAGKGVQAVVPDFEVPYHTEIMESFDGIDLDSARKVAGNGFYYLMGDIARLHSAVIAYARDFMIDRGFTYCVPPFMIRSNVVTGVMSFDEMDAMMYKIEGEDLYLIGTSEHSMIGKFIDTITDEKDLPKTLTSYSPCFRKEKGAHGIEELSLIHI